MIDRLEIELKVIEGTNQVLVVCANTGKIIGEQVSTSIVTSGCEVTLATVVFEIKALKD